MCGIAGIVAQNSHRYQEALQRMVEILRHRGPDEAGLDHFRDCSLGQARLSIVDLVSGKQPMRNDRETTGITFNGEIYGYKALRQALEPQYHFHTSSDTEVILAMYERYGERFIEKLPGMFAFALWDDESRELFCARDRFGEKPFYYAFGPRRELLFASEIKALLASGLVTPVLKTASLLHYLRRLYIHPHQTIYENIYTLPPAHILRYVQGTLSIERYWNFPALRESIDMQEAVEEFRRLLSNAVKRCLVADVPVGAFLSGGLDSSTIVAAASAHTKQLRTFSFGFGDAINELPFAKDVATLYQTEHTELSAHEYDVADLLVKMQDVYDEPFADSSNIPTFLLSEQARQHVKVVLTGDGGDELLAGYSGWYQPLLPMQNLFAKTPGLRWLFGMMLKFRQRYLHSIPPDWKRISKGVALRQKFGSIANAHYHQYQHLSNIDLTQLGFSGETFFRVIQDGRYTSDTLNDAMQLDLEDYMPGDILVKIDRASMAHGLELRAPLLDVELASFCISLPARLKITRDSDKILLRRAFAAEWPQSIRSRMKQGFGAPVVEWLQLPKVKQLHQEYLNDPTRKIFEVISFEGSRSFVAQNSYLTWILLVLSLWMERWEFQIASTQGN